MKNLRFTLILLIVFSYSNIHSQCENTLFGEEITAPTSETPSIMSSCNSTDEYNKVTNIQAGATYKIESTGGEGNYISVYLDAPNDNFLTAGESPLYINSEADADWYIHINSSYGCGTDTDCHETSISRFDGCLNLSPFGTFTAPTTSATMSVVTCIFAGEYTKVTDFSAGHSYAFTSTGSEGNYITLREGTFDGPVVAAGASPLSVSLTADTDLFIHINSDDECGVSNYCREVTVTCTTCCTPTILLQDGQGEETNSAICIGESITLVADEADEYVWNNGETTQSITVSPTTSTTYSVTTTGGVCPGTAQTMVFVTFPPTLTVSEDLELCAEDSISLSVNGGYTFEWTGPNDFNSTAPDPTIYDASEANSGTYYITVASIDGCISLDSVEVTVLPVPTAEITSNEPICKGDTLHLSVTENDSYSWSGPQGFQSNIQNPFIVMSTISMSGNFNVTVTNPEGCSTSESVYIEVHSIPNALAYSNSPICEGDTLKLQATGGETFSWSGPNGYQSTAQNPMIDNCTEANAGEYVVTVYSIYNCAADKAVNITIWMNPNIEEILVTENEDGSYTFDIEDNNTTNQYFWDFGDGQTATSQTPTHSYDEDGNYTVTLTVTNNCGTQELTTAIDQTSGVNDLQIEEQVLRIYPNPASHSVTFECAELKQLKTIIIVDELGKLVYQSALQSNTTTLDLTGYSTGIYYVKFQLEKGDWMYRKFSVVK